MSTRNLTEAILDGGIYSINFFNGRLLSGEDLSQEHSANSEARRRLGLAGGDGVAFGLEVSESVDASTKAAPVVTVKMGLAVNRLGHTLSLAADTDVSLVNPESTNTGTAAQALFATCLPPGSYVAGAGVYLLTIAPAAGTQGLAPVSGLGNVAASCNARYNIDGAQFHLIPISLPVDMLQDSARLRNNLAYSCLGGRDILEDVFAANPLGFTLAQGYGLLDTLRASRGANCLIDDDVPLAMIYWTVDGGIVFIDLWSVRRRIVRPPFDTRWPLFVGDRRMSEVEAMFLQFQAQVSDISTNELSAMESMVATDRFAYLPPAGFLPSLGAGAEGFNPYTFFGSLISSNIEMIDGSQLRALLHESFYHEPIDLSDSSTTNRVQLYTVWENVQATVNQQTDQLTVVFASHTLPYRGTARYGTAAFGVSRFTPYVR